MNVSRLDSYNKMVVPIVLHKIVHDSPSTWEDLSVSDLIKILDFIHNRWVVFSSLNQIKSMNWMLTFDDGNISDYDIVFPLLKEKGMKATFFLIVNKVGKLGYVNWSQVREMNIQGMSICSHSLNHRSMTKLSKLEAKKEFVESKKRIEDGIGKEVLGFSYPFGAYCNDLHNIGFEAGYKYIATSKHGLINQKSFVLPRNSINSSLDWNSIMKLLNPSLFTRIEWFVEDILKNALKSSLGKKNYITMRNILLRRKHLMVNKFKK